MMFTKTTFTTAVVAALSATNLVLAQTTPPGQTKVHVVSVGDAKGSLKFFPEELTAQPGELIQFHFYPKNHSVVQSSFQDPCIPIANSASGNGTKGFFSGFMPVAQNSDVMPTFTIPITDTKPIWFYCATGQHCQNGMVGVINAPQNNPQRTLSLYKEAAAKSKSSAPGSEFGGVSPNNTASVPTGTGTAPGYSATSSGKPGNSTGAASTVSASVSMLLGAIAAAFFLA